MKTVIQNLIFFSLVAIATAFLSGCDGCKNNPNTNDLTPPRIVWNIRNETSGESTRLVGTSNFTAERGVYYTVTLAPEDDGGLREISHSSSYAQNCTCGDNIGVSAGPSLGIITRTPLGLDEQGRAWTSYLAFFERVSLSGNCRGNNCRVTSETISFNGTAVNYSNLSANGVLTISLRI